MSGCNPPAAGLRPATNADCGTVTELVFRVLAEYGLDPDPESTDADLKDIEAAYQARGGSFDVLEDETGLVIGCVGVYPTGTSTCELRKMYLAPAFRGRGLGRRLLDHALDRARERGFSQVTLETASVLREAIALYVAYGFREYTSDHLAARCDQAFHLDL